MQYTPKKLLLIEDDTDIQELLSALLKQEGYEVDTAENGPDGETLALKQSYDLIILDVMLPFKDGLSVLRDIRPKISTPVLMLTAKGEALDRILGLEIGADDYLPKPFDPRELLARIKAMLRRTDMNQRDIKMQGKETQEFSRSSIRIIPKRREAWLEDSLIDLTTTEYDILVSLMQSHDEIVSKETLSEKALGRKLSLYDRAIDMHVSNLRKKLPDDLIKTIRGAGYMFNTIEI